jgi:putative nucleotidyltransferase with HDIG domain
MEPPDRVMLATPERLDDVAYAFARIIDAKSPFAYEHSEGVASVAAKLAAHMGFSEAEVREQRRAALLHDIGKLGISNRILGKPGKLTDEEFAKIQEHPALTYRLLMRVSPFRHLADLVASHHEKLDGTGYHRGLSAEDLDAPARILAVADVFDALTSHRPYRPALPLEKVLPILETEGISAPRPCRRCTL